MGTKNSALSNHKEYIKEITPCYLEVPDSIEFEK